MSEFGIPAGLETHSMFYNPVLFVQSLLQRLSLKRFTGEQKGQNGDGKTPQQTPKRGKRSQEEPGDREKSALL